MMIVVSLVMLLVSIAGITATDDTRVMEYLAVAMSVAATWLIVSIAFAAMS